MGNYGPNPEGLAVGLPVYTRGGELLGKVKAVVEDRFKVDRPMRPDTWLTTRAVADVRDGRVILIPLTEELSAYTEVAP